MTKRRFSAVLAFGVFGGLLILGIWRQLGSTFSPQIATNESDITALHQVPVNLESTEEVFAYVLSRLPSEVFVYPTENYYYWRFLMAGREVWGNIRLDVGDRAQGKVSFAYFEALNRPEAPDEFISHHQNFDAEAGMTLTKIDDFTYKIAYQKHATIFHLNELPQTPPLELKENERFVMRTQDESGFQFHLLFDVVQKHFMFVLDESEALPDQLKTRAPHLLIGQRTGFAFYQDDVPVRKILMAVDGDNVRKNNYFDGPFDQLADNFITDDTLKNFIETAYPYTQGRIDGRGIFIDQEGSRVAISPYATYVDQAELLKIVSDCEEDPATLRACLAYDYKRDIAR